MPAVINFRESCSPGQAIHLERSGAANLERYNSDDDLNSGSLVVPGGPGSGVARNAAPLEPNMHLAPASDPDRLGKSLQKIWNPNDRLTILRRKVQSYAVRHQCEARLLSEPEQVGGAPQSKELQILHRSILEGEAEQQMGEAEKYTAEVLKSGMRNFIDTALDEVDHVSRLTMKGRTSSDFSWKSQGNPRDNPCLRQSLGVNGVKDGKGHWIPNREDETSDAQSPPTSNPTSAVMGERAAAEAGDRPEEAFPDVDFVVDYYGGGPRMVDDTRISGPTPSAPPVAVKRFVIRPGFGVPPPEPSSRSIDHESAADVWPRGRFSMV